MENRLTLYDIKDKVHSLKGQNINLKINKGRNKIQFFKGRIDQIYSSVFVVKIENDVFDRLSCTYQDVLCGDVKFKVIEQA